ncbi:hypothetical protein [Halobacteriovorax sp. RZ-2]|uniref:hypothetical protein n=1 Tax=unclassified Halobacteriovorax TaxID=2639665 RepID=UPI003711C647
MKKQIFALSLLLSSTAFANRVMPEISKDGKTRHSSSMAVANDRRQFFNTQFEGGSAEIQDIDTLDSSDFDINGAFGNRVFSAEFSYNDNVGFAQTRPIITEVGHNREAVLLMGFRPVDLVSFGFGYRNIERDMQNKNINTFEVEASTMFNINRVSFGGAYKYVKPNSQRHGYYADLTLAGGYLDEVLSAEAGLSVKTKSQELNRGTRKEFFIGGTRKYSNLEFDTDFEYESGDNGYETGDYKRMKFNFDLEVLYTKYLYVTPGIEYRNLEINNSSSEQIYTSVDFGYREAGMDITLAFDYLADGNLEIANQDIKLDQYRVTLGMGYQF